MTFKGTHILIWSSNPVELVKFYTDVLELEIDQKVDLPAKNEVGEDYGYQLKSGDVPVCWIGRHSEVIDKSKEPVRIMHNLKTDDVEYWFNKVKEAGCEILQEPAETPFSTEERKVYVCTWLDPDGNCWQFMGGLSTGDRS
jgi:uncharacterized glyoxalase superfamily protein PhnB